MKDEFRSPLLSRRNAIELLGLGGIGLVTVTRSSGQCSQRRRPTPR